MCDFCEKLVNDMLPINTNMSLDTTFAVIARGAEQMEIVLHVCDRDRETGHRFVGTYGIPITFCPICGNKVKSPF